MTNWRAIEVKVLVTVAMLYSLVACAPENRSTGSFQTLPVNKGWSRAMPLVFEPEYGDSSATYDIVVAVRHTNEYGYSNLPLVVDLIADSSKIARRVPVEVNVADEFGNWKGTGFGSLYQCRALVAESVSPLQAHKVVVWQAMADTALINNITEVGVIVNVHK